MQMNGEAFLAGGTASNQTQKFVFEGLGVTEKGRERKQRGKKKRSGRTTRLRRFSFSFARGLSVFLGETYMLCRT